MHVLHINTERGWRGGESQTLHTLHGLTDHGISVELFSTAGAELTEIALMQGFLVHWATGLVPLFVWLLFNARRFDILHAHNGRGATALACYRCIAPVLTVFTRRTDYRSRFKDWLRRMKWRRLDKIVAISQAAAAEPLRLGLQPTIIRSAVPLTVANQTRISLLRAKHNLAQKTLIGTSAIFTADKDPLTSIRVAAEVCKRRSDVVFLHWGAGGELESAAKKYVAELGLDKQYLLLGFVANPEELYSALSAFYLTSRAEALGTSVLDAMVQNIPVVATSAGGLKETLAEERGLLAPAGDERVLAEQLIWILSHPVESAAMASRAFDYVRAEHNIEAMINSYAALYRSMLQESSTRARSCP
jgi:glycosyltransferase involved in cell wall biosynthesis